MTVEQPVEVEEQVPESARAIPVVVDPRPDLPLVFANHAEITHSRYEFFLTLSQVIPPTVRNQADLAALDSVHAMPVARVVMSPVLVEKLIEVLGDNYGKFRSRRDSDAGENELLVRAEDDE